MYYCSKNSLLLSCMLTSPWNPSLGQELFTSMLLNPDVKYEIHEKEMYVTSEPNLKP